MKLDLSAGSIHTTLIDGLPHIVLKPAVEDLGLDYSTQLAKLRKRSWAVVGQSPTTGSDGKTYNMAVIPVRTFLMLLATVNENRVAFLQRKTLVAFQNETADAIEAYWTKGGAINERATDEQLDALEQQIEERRIRRALGLVQLIAAMDDTVDPKWKRSRQLHHYAEAAGEIAEIPAADRALLVETYLKDRGLTDGERRSVRSSFGRRVSLAFQMQYGEKPKDSIGLVDGRERQVKSYTEADRPMFDKVWDEFYADRYPAQQQFGEAS
ncbi:phage antirepressor N-terminal domain-containing protein [Streptomyces sp. KL116D]|uniref:phage antirepressor N-terminal domain-containing protein n=1 Tax=Streptomyces sp. KL116D TaxID=3045152 RepID=UPI003558D36C